MRRMNFMQTAADTVESVAPVAWWSVWPGWVGGVIGACVSITLTVLWQSRIRRRDRLDDAVSVLAARADELRSCAFEICFYDRQPETFDPLLDGYIEAFFRVRASARRRVFLFPARIAAPTRAGLDRTLVGLLTELSNAGLQLKVQGSMREHYPDIDVVLEAKRALVAAQAATLVCAEWTHNPWQFLRGKDLAQLFLAEARETAIRNALKSDYRSIQAACRARGRAAGKAES